MTMMKKAAVMLLLSTVLTVSVFSADAPSPLQQGDILINGGLGFGSYNLNNLSITGVGWWANYGNYFLLGGYVAADYVLPINFPLTVGIEWGVSGAKIPAPHVNVLGGSASAIPFLARVAWHPHFGIANLDTYALFKMGYTIGFFGGEIKDKMTINKQPGGFTIALDIGARYFFTEHLGVFGEFGYERVMGRYDVSYSSSSPSFYFYSYGSSPFQRFSTLGVTYKL
jgi:hypothetical protein